MRRRGVVRQRNALFGTPLHCSRCERAGMCVSAKQCSTHARGLTRTLPPAIASSSKRQLRHLAPVLDFPLGGARAAVHFCFFCRCGGAVGVPQCPRIFVAVRRAPFRKRRYLTSSYTNRPVCSVWRRR